ncbi:MAG: OadG family protein [Desulfurococcaceae archaeon]
MFQDLLQDSGNYIVVIALLGIIAVFSVLSLLSLTTTAIVRLCPIAKRKETEETQQKTSAKTSGEAIKETIEQEEAAIITAAVLAFLEFKLKALMRSAVIGQLPILARVIPSSGIFFGGKLKLKVKGAEKEVEVLEDSQGLFLVNMGPKTYSVTVKPPYDKVELSLIRS